jgi:hypothetical protein
MTTFINCNKFYEAGMAMKLTPLEESNLIARVVRKCEHLKPKIKLYVNRTKVTDSRTGKTWTPTKKQYFNQPTKENVEVSSQSIVEMLTRKAAATAERKRRENSDANRFMNGSAVDAYIKEKTAQASAIATAVAKTRFNEEEGSWARPADTPASATLRNKPNVQKSKAADTIKQYNVNINLDLPTPEQLGFCHSPTQKPAVQQRTPRYEYPGMNSVPNDDKQWDVNLKSPRKPKQGFDSVNGAI